MSEIGRRFRLVVEYDGADFAGWQVQPGERTVQGELEAALHELTGAEVRVQASGRTDSGVHAFGQVVAFRSEKDLDANVVRRALNALVGTDLAVRSAALAEEDFDPRRSARRRTYEYRIWNDRPRSPFWRNYSWHLSAPLDVEAMRIAAAALLGEHDFTSFRAAGCDAKTPVRRVYESEIVTGWHSLLIYRVTATAFLRHMVRNIVGTLVEVGRGQRDAASIPALLESRNRDLAGATAPPHGLCLTEVGYEDAP